MDRVVPFSDKEVGTKLQQSLKKQVKHLLICAGDEISLENQSFGIRNKK